ncbi:MAG: ABC transporter substrate-binding protein [Treponema sp.]|jgi:iron complex transport system substrate-binding protein|nr:ABC transporter substrate-binding protein [Treponema sp.]
MKPVKTLGLFFLLCLAASAAFAAGRRDSGPPAGPAAEGDVPLYWTIVRDEGGGEFIRDTNGFSVPLRAYERIILISPGAVETFYLIGAEDRIVAISSSRDPVWPGEKTALLPSIGNAARPNLEAMVALEPDLIIGNAMSVAIVTDLVSRGYAALIHGADSIADIFNTTRIMGRLTGKAEAAEQVVREKEERLQSLRRDLAQRPLRYRGAPLKGAFLYSASPLMAFTEKSLPGEILSILGLVNIAAGLDAAQPILSPEYILDQNPDFLFGSMAVTRPEDVLAADSVILQTRAGREKNIRLVSSSLFLRTSPRIVDGLLDMYGEVEAFSDNMP